MPHRPLGSDFRVTDSHGAWAPGSASRAAAPCASHRGNALQSGEAGGRELPPGSEPLSSCVTSSTPHFICFLKEETKVGETRQLLVLSSQVASLGLKPGLSEGVPCTPFWPCCHLVQGQALVLGELLRFALEKRGAGSPAGQERPYLWLACGPWVVGLLGEWPVRADVAFTGGS